MTSAVEFSHKVKVDPWPDNGVAVDLAPSDSEREALRARADLLDLPRLSVSAAIDKRAMELVLSGRIKAEVIQTCVVTLKPVTSSLDVPFERHFRKREAHEKMMAAGLALSLDEEEIDIDILEGDEIDIGEVVAEELCLALDPYPRADDADQVLEEIRTKTGATVNATPANPFEKLRRH